MKQLFTLTVITLLCIACSTEEETVLDQTSSFEIEELALENYKGVFTTTDGGSRGALDVTVSQDGLSATANLTLSTGEVVAVFTDQVTDLGVSKEITFTSNELSFTMTTGNETEVLEIDAVTFRGSESAILASRNTSRAPVTPITGTYLCTTCGGSVDNMTTQTFNLMFTTGGGNSTIASQTTVGMTVFNGIAVQDNCVVNGTTTVCDLTSGDGVTNVGYTAGSGDVTWSGIHTFNNEATGANDCSGVSGTWSWDSSVAGLVTGTFVSDTVCPTELVFEDFEDATVGYVIRDEVNGGGVISEDITEIEFEDYIGRVALTDFAADDEYFVSNIQGNNFFGVGDQDGILSIGNVDMMSINWEGIDVSAFSTITVSSLFAEDDNSFMGNLVENWDFDSSVRIEYSFNGGSTWVPTFAIECLNFSGDNASAPFVDNNFDGIGDGTEIIPFLIEYGASFSTGGATTMNVRIIIENLNGGNEDIAIDNVTIIGS